MKNSGRVDSASSMIDAKIKELGDWRGKMLAKVREIIYEADPEIIEEWKWVKPSSAGTPVFPTAASSAPARRTRMWSR